MILSHRCNFIPTSINSSQNKEHPVLLYLVVVNTGPPGRLWEIIQEKNSREISRLWGNSDKKKVDTMWHFS